MSRRDPNAFRCANGMTLAELRDAATEAGRHCTTCGGFKPWDEFPRLKRGFRGRGARCKKCWAAYVAEWNKQDHAKASRKRQIIRRIYGEAGLAAHDRLRAGGGCDICGGRGPRMAIDHCHATGAVRGLLCKYCNWILGIVEDDPERLRALAGYLETAASANA